MQNWLTKHGCGNIYLFMNPDIFMSENMDALPELPEDTYQTEGYPEEMALVYPPLNGTNRLHLNLKEILSLYTDEATRGQNIYQFRLYFLLNSNYSIISNGHLQGLSSVEYKCYLSFLDLAQFYPAKNEQTAFSALHP